MVYSSIYQSDILCKKDKEAQISIDGLNSSIKSTVDFIYPTLMKNKTVDVRFILDNQIVKLFQVCLENWFNSK